MKFRSKKVLVACEFSGAVTSCLNNIEGIHAMSCDLLPTEGESRDHFQGDVQDCIIRESWDMVIAFPPCTYLCNSGVRWLHERPERWQDMQEAAKFFNMFLNLSAPLIAVENPTMHKHAGIRKPDFAVQPWNFGDAYTKRTCFWTKGLPQLEPEIGVAPPDLEHLIHRMPPSPDRAKERSRTPPGLARAIAKQWGEYCLSQQAV